LTNLASPQSNPPHQLTSTQPTQDSYKVCFKAGNISVCNGCRKSFTDYDVVVVQHAEYNAYYHPLKACIQLKWGTAFNSSNLAIPDAVRNKLTFPQREQLYQEFAVL